MTRYDLLLIDPQNDFMDIEGAALPVGGAQADMQRVADWLRGHLDAVRSITVTMDTHASVGIERTTFWLDAQGQPVPPFTLITAEDVASNRFKTRTPALREEALRYLQALEQQARQQLVVWPVHCVLGTWGHNLHAGLAQAIAAWELHTGRLSHKVLKGQHPLTEQYSAFKAEVPRADDPRTSLNTSLIHSLAAGEGTMLIAGEAQSHCVAASVQDLMAHLPPARLSQAVLLSDCMSPVAGFEAQAERFMQQAQAHGIKVRTLASL